MSKFVYQSIRRLVFLSLLVIVSGCGGSGGVLGGAQLGSNPWIDANDAFVIRDCTSVFENLARAELNPDLSEEIYSRLVYMRGSCHEQLGDISDAVGAYKYLVTKHPNTASSFLAGERLRNLSEQVLREAGG